MYISPKPQLGMTLLPKIRRKREVAKLAAKRPTFANRASINTSTIKYYICQAITCFSLQYQPAVSICSTFLFLRGEGWGACSDITVGQYSLGWVEKLKMSKKFMDMKFLL